MIVAARPSSLSLVCHAVEDSGAVCGARPRHGRWHVTERVPVNCPRCLLRLSVPRFALCRIPMPAGRRDMLHVRLVGPKGFRPRGPLDTNTLCGRSPMMDVELLPSQSPVPHDELCGRCSSALPEASEGRLRLP